MPDELEQVYDEIEKLFGNRLRDIFAEALQDLYVEEDLNDYFLDAEDQGRCPWLPVLSLEEVTHDIDLYVDNK